MSEEEKNNITPLFKDREMANATENELDYETLIGEAVDCLYHESFAQFFEYSKQLCEILVKNLGKQSFENLKQTNKAYKDAKLNLERLQREAATEGIVLNDMPLLAHDDIVEADKRCDEFMSLVEQIAEFLNRKPEAEMADNVHNMHLSLLLMQLSAKWKEIQFYLDPEDRDMEFSTEEGVDEEFVESLKSYIESTKRLLRTMQEHLAISGEYNTGESDSQEIVEKKIIEESTNKIAEDGKKVLMDMQRLLEEKYGQAHWEPKIAKFREWMENAEIHNL